MSHRRRRIRAADQRQPTGEIGNRPVSALVFSAHGTDVDTVLVNGEVVLRGGNLRFGSEREVLDDARRIARETIERAGLQHRVDVHWRPTA